MERPLYVIDSSVLIDYVQTRIQVLELITTHLGRVVILPSTLDEVDNFEKDDCHRLGMEILTPSLEEYAEAALHREPGLSAEDFLCLIVSERLAATCLTNDVALHKACRRRGVRCMYGLRPMLNLTEIKVLSPREAWRIAQAISASNLYITDAIIEEFSRELNRIVAQRAAAADTRSKKRSDEPRR